MNLINNNPYSPLPHPKQNGGLDSGHGANGPWGSLPIIYDASWLTRENLKSADNVPPSAFYQLQSGIRPGNNTYIPIPEVRHYDSNNLDIYCIKEECKQSNYPNLCKNKIYINIQ